MTASDIPEGDWIDRFVAPGLRPYLRLARVDRPIGTFLLLFPCWWGVALASPGFPDPVLLVLFAIGAVAMRAAGCIVNDIADREFDAQVARTQTRPIASGAIPVKRAAVFLGLLLLVGLAVLVCFNRFAIVLGLASVPLIVAYPFTKRFTYWPQAFLGLTFNWGALLGFAAVKGTLEPAALLLYAAGLFWTLGYDTIYAHQDREDDALIGVKSLALKLGTRTRPFLFAFYGVCLALIGVAGFAARLGPPFYGWLVTAGAHLFWQAGRVDLDDPRDCLAKFRSNTVFGGLILLALVLGAMTVF
ncbi:MAG: 4-hydroxybenzoate octaprenyltransferase [Alphaproteobacteria bacterium]